jgi:hypothetical protein
MLTAYKEATVFFVVNAEQQNIILSLLLFSNYFIITLKKMGLVDL